MIAFANKNQQLSVVIGSLVYELPMKSGDQAQRLAKRAADDADFQDMLKLACKAQPRVASRAELEAGNDCRMRVWTGPYA
jgi:hypothetical protein